MLAQSIVQKTKFGNDPEGLLRFINDTHIVDLSGKKTSYHVEPRELSSAFFDIDMGINRFAYLPAAGGDCESFFPLDRLLLIDGPLIVVEDGDRKSVV